MTIRRMKKEEVEPAAQLCFDSFKAFNDSVRLPCEFDGVVPVALMAFNQAHPKMACFVAVMEPTNEIVGTNCIDLRDDVGVRAPGNEVASFRPLTLHPPTIHWQAIGPIAVAPALWGKKIGEALMKACIQAAEDAGKRKTMLMQVGRKGGRSHAYLSRPSNLPLAISHTQTFILTLLRL